MNKNEKYSIEKYDSLAGTYDASFDGKFTARFKQAMLAMCDVSDGDRVLDVGCGNGRLIYEISCRAHIAAHGVDISPTMIKICAKQYENIDFVVTSGENLLFDADRMDMLTICCVLHHLHNPQKFFSEAERVLAKDGILLVGEPCFPLVIRKLADWIISPLLKAGDNKLFGHKRLKRLFEDNGFLIVEIYKKGFKQIIKGRKLGASNG